MPKVTAAIGWAAGLVIALPLALFLSAGTIQERLLYHPVKAAVAQIADRETKAWPAPDDFRGLLAEPAGPARATVVVFHGNYGNVGNRRYYAAALTRLGLRVILAEYPGYGPRDGPIDETSLVADAARTIALARQEYGAPLLVVGESLGAGVAAAASAREREAVAAVWLITPWDRLENAAALHYPWLPVHTLLRDRYDSAAHLAAFGRPVLVTVAEHDALVPARLGRALYQALADPRRLTVVGAAGHNDWMRHVDGAWWAAAVGYLLGP